MVRFVFVIMGCYVGCGTPHYKLICSLCLTDQNLNGFFHKEDEKLVMAPFPREAMLNADINTSKYPSPK